MFSLGVTEPFRFVNEDPISIGSFDFYALLKCIKDILAANTLTQKGYLKYYVETRFLPVDNFGSLLFCGVSLYFFIISNGVISILPLSSFNLK